MGSHGAMWGAWLGSKALDAAQTGAPQPLLCLTAFTGVHTGLGLVALRVRLGPAQPLGDVHAGTLGQCGSEVGVHPLGSCRVGTRSCQAKLLILLQCEKLGED